MSTLSITELIATNSTLDLSSAQQANNHSAAVLVLCDRARQQMVLTKRAIHLNHHPGEFCFAGGRWHEADDDLAATALRETEEELGICQSRIDLISTLPKQLSFYGYHVYPFIAFIDELFPYTMDAGEVELVVSLPLTDVINPFIYETITHQKKQFNFKTLRYIDDKHFIWGLTARIMQDFAKLYRRIL